MDLVLFFFLLFFIVHKKKKKCEFWMRECTSSFWCYVQPTMKTFCLNRSMILNDIHILHSGVERYYLYIEWIWKMNNLFNQQQQQQWRDKKIEQNNFSNSTIQPASQAGSQSVKPMVKKIFTQFDAFISKKKKPSSTQVLRLVKLYFQFVIKHNLKF